MPDYYNNNPLPFSPTSRKDQGIIVDNNQGITSRALSHPYYIRNDTGVMMWYWLSGEVCCYFLVF